MGQRAAPKDSKARQAQDPEEFFAQARATLAWKSYLQEARASADPGVVARVNRLMHRYAEETVPPLRPGRSELERQQVRDHLALCLAARSLIDWS